MKALILSGGQGSRLTPFTLTTPKPLLSILNIPLIVYQIQLLKYYNIKEIGLGLSYKSDKFKKILGNNKKYGIKIHYLIEKTPMGTGGAIKYAEQFLNGDYFFVFNGDILTDINLSEMLKFHIEKKAFVTIACVKVKEPYNYGVILTDKNSRIKKFVEKPENFISDIINAGIYILNSKILDEFPDKKNISIEREIFPLLIKKGIPVFAYIYDGYWIDAGTCEKFLQATDDIIQKKYKIDFLNEKDIMLGEKNLIYGKNVKIPKDLKIKGWAVVGNKSIIKESVTIEKSIIFSDVHIGKGVYISDSIIGNNVYIGDNSVIENSYIGDKSFISDFSKI
jgi:NDP-sugar pyrophosphorylase family protein